MKTMTLRVRMTTAEREARSTQLVDALANKSAVETRKKAEASAAKEEIDRIDEEIAAAAEDLRLGGLLREVDVDERLNMERRSYETIRLDTYEVVSSRGMTDTEYRKTLQVPLFAAGVRVQVRDFPDLAAPEPKEPTKASAHPEVDLDAPGGQEIPAPKPAAPLTATLEEHVDKQIAEDAPEITDPAKVLDAADTCPPELAGDGPPAPKKRKPRKRPSFTRGGAS